jgi:putative membrane protein
MIVRPRPKLWELFFIWRLSILTRILPQILMAAVTAIAISVWWHFQPRLFAGFSVAPFTLLGIALSIFLGFRNNACYDRWWEARRQLGALVGEVRSLARLTMTLPGGDRERRERAVRKTIVWIYALMAHLRGEPFASKADAPDALLHGIAAEYAAMFADREFGEQLYQRFDERLSNMAMYQVACERIRSTPTPFVYSLLLYRTAYAFSFLLPFGLVTTFGYASVVFSALVAYTFFGLDALGDEMEEPFGDWPNSLPLNAMARTMEISLLEAVGDDNIPAPLGPVRNILR